MPDYGALAQILGAPGAALEYGVNAPIEEMKGRLGNDMTLENIYKTRQDRTFDAQMQPVKLEHQGLQNASMGLDNRGKTVDVAAKEQLGPQYQVDKALGEQDKATMERTLKQVDLVGHAAAMLSQGMPALQVQDWLVKNGRMPPQMAGQMIQMGPEQMQAMATKMQLSTKAGELQAAKLAAQAKAQEEGDRRRQDREFQIQRDKDAAAERRAMIVAITSRDNNERTNSTNLQISRERFKAAAARSGQGKTLEDEIRKGHLADPWKIYGAAGALRILAEASGDTEAAARLALIEENAGAKVQAMKDQGQKPDPVVTKTPEGRTTIEQRPASQRGTPYPGVGEAPKPQVPVAQAPPSTLADLKKMYPNKTDAELKDAYKRKYNKDIQ